MRVLVKQLLFTDEGDGFHVYKGQNNNMRTLRQFNRYKLLDRYIKFTTLLYSDRLFQQYLSYHYLESGTSDLRFIKKSKKTSCISLDIIKRISCSSRRVLRRGRLVQGRKDDHIAFYVHHQRQLYAGKATEHLINVENVWRPIRFSNNDV